MKYLIDTHTFLWYITDSKLISETATKTINNKSNDILVSNSSLWEISIKNSKGNLPLNYPFESIFNEIVKNKFNVLPLDFPHLIIHNKLPFHHRDPFDRALISQAIYEEIDVISIDAIIDEYLVGTNVKRIW